MTYWSNETHIKFLKYYQTESVIWDPMHVAHKDKKMNDMAWLRLSEIMGFPVAELKRKKDSLMATFRGHVRKKKASIRAGAEGNNIYKPVWFAFEVMESFLAPIYECTSTTTNTQNSVKNSFSSNLNSGQYEEETSTESDSRVPDQSIPISTQLRNVRRRANSPELQEARNQVKQAFTMLNNIIGEKSTDKEEDECGLYTKMLARKLRKLPEDDREIVMHEIDDLVFKRRRLINSFPSSNFPSPSASSSYLPPIEHKNEYYSE